jgi:hypothetical protein
MTPRQSFARFLVAAAFVAGGATLFAQEPRVLPNTIGDLNTAKLVEVVDPKGEVLLHGTFKTSSSTAKETEREAELISPSGQKAKGEVEIEIERKDSTIENEIEVEVEHLPANLQCELRIDGKVAATFLTSKKGKAEFELERTDTAPGK